MIKKRNCCGTLKIVLYRVILWIGALFSMCCNAWHCYTCQILDFSASLQLCSKILWEIASTLLRSCCSSEQHCSVALMPDTMSCFLPCNLTCSLLNIQNSIGVLSVYIQTQKIQELINAFFVLSRPTISVQCKFITATTIILHIWIKNGWHKLNLSQPSMFSTHRVTQILSMGFLDGQLSQPM